MKRFFYAASLIIATTLIGAAEEPQTKAPASSSSDASAQSDASTALTGAPVRKENAMERAVTAKVRAALASKGSEETTATGPSPRSDIQVSTERGVVTLRGKVNSDSEKQAIIDKVQSLNGVTIVKNELQVTAPATDSVGSQGQGGTDSGTDKAGSKAVGGNAKGSSGSSEQRK